MKTNKIWCLFSIANDYNQPENNLVCWWDERPNEEQLKSIGINEADIKTLLKSGHGGSDWYRYRLQTIEKGKKL